MHDICSECGEHCEAEEEIDENISKSTAILNRPSNRMTFEQMGMIMVLADELGGEENAKANEFVSGVVTKMKADEYIKELKGFDTSCNFLNPASNLILIITLF